MAEHLDSEYTVTLDARRWADDEILHDDFARAFGFPEYYGRNLDALEECLREVAVAQSARGGSLVIVLRNLPGFERAHAATSAALLDVLGELAATSSVHVRLIAEENVIAEES